MKDRVWIFDTTLRDGAQMEGISFSSEDKKDILLKLDELGIDFIEGGMPASNPTDSNLFSSAPQLKSNIVAFGSTAKPGIPVSEDLGLNVLASVKNDWVCIFGKSWKFHVSEVLKITDEENLTLISESISFLRSKGKRVIFDAEHYFDGFKNDRDYAIKVVKTAQKAGAEWITLCDTNGGNLPDDIGHIVECTLKETSANLGIHCHNDSDLAVACTLSAVDHGARLVQGTMNGIGERCGNANLCSVMPNLSIKMDYEINADLSKLTSISAAIADISNISTLTSMPFVGSKAFTHKGGMHIDALLKNNSTYEHIKPESVGNNRNILVSDQSGKAGIIKKMNEFSIEHNPETVKKVLEKVKEMESKGYQFEAADASLELLMRRTCEIFESPYSISSFRMYIDEIGTDDIKSEASIKIQDIHGNTEHTASDGDGPVDALSNALKKALSKFFPVVNKIRLIDYKVRVLDEKAATAGPVRVLIKTTDGTEQWTTIGVSTNVIEASLIALTDSMDYAVFKDSRKAN